MEERLELLWQDQTGRIHVGKRSSPKGVSTSEWYGRMTMAVNHKLRPETRDLPWPHADKSPDRNDAQAGNAKRSSSFGEPDCGIHFRLIRQDRRHYPDDLEVAVTWLAFAHWTR